MEASTPATDVLDTLRSGRRDTLDRLMPVVYEQLRGIARHQLSMRPGGGTLSTTGLVHEAYLKLVDQSRVAWRDRGHFFALQEETGEAVGVTTRTVQRDWVKARMLLRRALSS